MIIDARQLPQDETINCDICIVGAGAAGITLAHELGRKEIKVVLLESGGTKFEPAIQELNKGDVNLNVHSSLEGYRRRNFGGTTTVWGGRCVPFDDIDFEYRSYVPYSGWSITKNDIDPYYKRAHVYLDIGDYTYDIKEVIPIRAQQKSLIPGFQSSDISIDKFYRFSPPTNFLNKFLTILKKQTNIQVYLYANCLKIMTNLDGKNVAHLQVASINKNQFQVYAKQYILAGGGLEVARLLLLSNDVHSQGIGNDFDMVGRFYMCHLTHGIQVQLKPNIIWDYEKTVEGYYCQRSIAVKEDKQRQFKLLNHRAFIQRPDIRDPSHRTGGCSATYLAKYLLGKENDSERIFDHIKNILYDLNGSIAFSGNWLTKRVISQRKIPNIIAKTKSNFYTLQLDSEQSPNPNSRVTLSESKDTFGFNKLKVDWRHNDLDVHSMIKSLKLIGQAIINSGVGQIQLFPDLTPKALAGHHIGTTRMSSSPQHGVVDQNCQVHGLNNLYIASSSVFPTSSYANPTLTIVAMAIRLADYIKLQMCALT